MRDQIVLKLSKWPFLLGDALLLGAAVFIYFQSKLLMGPWQIAFVVLCVAGGAALGIMPFLLDYRLFLKLAETRALGEVASKIQNLEAIAAQITSATNRWHNVQEEADKTAAAAKEIGERMAAEVRAFTEFMRRANDGEKATLRLEAEKSRRAENDWLQVLVRTLDHVYALHQGALRSGQANLIEQVGHFQNACREAARRVGLTPFIAAAAEPFDAQRHQLLEADAKAPADATVADTIAAGYTFQGKLLRPALVRLRDTPGGADGPLTGNGTEASPPDPESQLPLEPAGNPPH